MDYAFWFWVFIAFFLGRATGKKKYFIYIGYSEEKYSDAFIGIKLRQ